MSNNSETPSLNVFIRGSFSFLVHLPLETISNTETAVKILVNTAGVLDNPITYRLIAIISYIQFLGYVISFDPNSVPIFPNPIYLGLLIFLQMVLTVIAQKHNPQLFTLVDLVKRHLLALLPPFLGAKTIRDIAKHERSRENDPLYILSYYVILIILLVLGGVMLLLMLGILVFLRDKRILFLIYSSTLGLIGMSLGDWTSHYFVKGQKISFVGKIVRDRVSVVIGGSQARRLTVLTLSSAILLILMIIDLHVVFPIL